MSDHHHQRLQTKRSREDTPPVLNVPPPEALYSTERFELCVDGRSDGNKHESGELGATSSSDSAVGGRNSSNPRLMKRFRAATRSSLARVRGSSGNFSSTSSLSGSNHSRSSMSSLLSMDSELGGIPRRKGSSSFEFRRRGIRGESMDDMNDLLELEDDLDLDSMFRASRSSLMSDGMDSAMLNPLSLSPRRRASHKTPKRNGSPDEKFSQNRKNGESFSASSVFSTQQRRTSSLFAMGVEPLLMQKFSHQMKMLRRSSNINPTDSPPPTSLVVKASQDSPSDKNRNENSAKTQDQIDFLSASMSRNFAFKTLPAAVMDGMASYFIGRSFEKGQVVIKQGAPGDYFYIVESGVVQVTRDDKNVALRERGDSFGEMALLYNCPRNATLITLTPCVLWMVDRITFRHVVTRCLVGRDIMVAKALKNKTPWLHQALSPEQVTVALRSFKVHQFTKGDTLLVVDSNAPHDNQSYQFFVLQEGNVKCVRGDDATVNQDGVLMVKESSKDSADSSMPTQQSELSLCFPHENGSILYASKNHTFGGALALLEGALSNDRVLNREATLEEDASEDDWGDASRWSTGQGDLVRYVADSESVIVLTLDTASFRELIDPGNLSSRQNAPASGSGRKRSETEEFIIDNIIMTVREALMRISRNWIVGCRLAPLNPSSTAEDYACLDADESPARPTAHSIGKKSTLKKLDFANMQRVKVLGLGSFGRVELVRYCDPAEGTSTPQLFALKIQQKANIVASRQTKASMRERLLLEQCNHTFICKLHATFADQHLLYMLLECVRGGELFQLLSIQPGRRVPYVAARFYAGCVIDALSYMHAVPRRILYRDIKPENLLIDEAGYLKIVDFGFAKCLTEDTAYRTYTFCGTPDYIAPEMLSGSGYDHGVDVWAIGVLIFEMIFGYAPFGETPSEFFGNTMADGQSDQNNLSSISSGCESLVNARDSGDFAADIAPVAEECHTPLMTLKAIIFDDVKFPSESVLPIAGDHGTISKDLIKSILVKRPERRLGCACAGGILNLFRHKWFESFDLDALRCRRMPTPWTPELKGDDDVVDPAENYSWDFHIEPFVGDNSWCEEW